MLLDSGSDMDEGKTSDITLDVLRSIRDEIKGPREDTNRRFAQMDKRFVQMDKRFERIEADISQMREDIHYIVTRFDRGMLLKANDLENVKARLHVCEQRLGIQN